MPGRYHGEGAHDRFLAHYYPGDAAQLGLGPGQPHLDHRRVATAADQLRRPLETGTEADLEAMERELYRQGYTREEVAAGRRRAYEQMLQAAPPPPPPSRPAAPSPPPYPFSPDYRPRGWLMQQSMQAPQAATTLPDARRVEPSRPPIGPYSNGYRQVAPTREDSDYGELASRRSRQTSDAWLSIRPERPERPERPLGNGQRRAYYGEYSDDDDEEYPGYYPRGRNGPRR